MAKLKAGIIGLGVGEAHIPGFENDTCMITKICDFDPDKLLEVGKRHPDYIHTTDPNDILCDPDLDIVSIASYDQYHCEQIITALEHDKHVFVEKPICLTRQELDKITDALSEKPQLRLSSNLILRKAPRFMELKSQCDQHNLGQLYYMEGDYDYGRVHKITEGWRGESPFYSVTHGGGIHLIDLLLWLSGEHVSEVFAYGNDIPTRDTIFKYKSLCSALLKTANGCVIKISANYASVTPHHHKLCLYGTKGSFIQSHMGAHYLTSRERGEGEMVCDEDYPGVLKDGLIPNFLASITEGENTVITIQEIIDAMTISLAIEESLATSKPVSPSYTKVYD